MVHKSPTERFRGGLDYNLVGAIPPYAPLQGEIEVEGKNIVGVFGDQGGFNAVKPVLEKALAAKCKVTLYLAAACKEGHGEGTLTLDGAAIHPAPDKDTNIYGDFDRVNGSLLVVGASHSPEGIDAARNALILWNHKALCVEDTYGSARDILNSAFSEKLDSVCVIDEFAQSQITSNFPSFKERVVVTGGPQFDKTLNVKVSWEKERANLRTALGVTDQQQVFLVAGGINGTPSILRLLEEGIMRTGLSKTARVVLRQHTKRSTPQDKHLVQQYLASGSTLQLVDTDPNLGFTSDDLLPGVDFVLSPYSTTNHFGILYEMPGVIYVGTPEIVADHIEEKGSKRPPEIEAGAAWYVEDGSKMTHAISSALISQSLRDTHPELRSIKEAQARIASYNDGHATDRVFQEVKRLLKVA